MSGALYSKEELAFIKCNRKMPRRNLLAAFVERFGRTITLNGLYGICKTKGWRTGRAFRLKKGQCPPGGEKFRFKKGHIPPQAKTLGHESTDKGYIRVSVAKTSPSGFERTMVPKHRWLWEQQHGPIPRGMILKCKGERSNSDPSNWECVPNSVLFRLQNRGHTSAPAVLKPTIMAVAKLEDSIRKKSRPKKKVVLSRSKQDQANSTLNPDVR